MITAYDSKTRELIRVKRNFVVKRFHINEIRHILSKKDVEGFFFRKKKFSEIINELFLCFTLLSFDSISFAFTTSTDYWH